MATWLQNEPTASKRRCLLRVMNMATGQLASRGIDFTGYVYITRGGSKSYAALGTIENHRRALVVADDVVESVDTGTDALTLTAHGYETGDGPFVADEVMGTIAIGDPIYIIVDDANTIGIASTAALAYAGTREALTGTETGATISDSADTERGIDGEFIVTATQAETSYSVTELIISIYGYASHEGQTTVTIQGSGDGDVVLEGAYTRDDLRRVQLRTMAAKFSKVGNVFTFRDLADTKDSHTGTVTASGRIVISIIDPT